MQDCAGDTGSTPVSKTQSNAKRSSSVRRKANKRSAEAAMELRTPCKASKVNAYTYNFCLLQHSAFLAFVNVQLSYNKAVFGAQSTSFMNVLHFLRAGDLKALDLWHS